MSAIVMTGASSGFGAIAAGALADSGAVLLTGSRGPAAGERLELDLARLASVRSFAAAVDDRLEGTPIDALVLNAGLIRPDATGRTADGFETTFGVNHLSHFLLLGLLRHSLAEHAVVVLTTSGTHDPATRAGLTTPRHAEVALLAHPELDAHIDQATRTAGEHAYTASKLCTALTARALARSFAAEAGRRRAIAFDPGQVFGTRLARQLPLVRRVAWSVLGSRALGWLPRLLSDTGNSRAATARALVELASAPSATLGAAAGPETHGYAALRRGRLRWIEPSTMARDDELGARLWRDSARLVGLADH